MIEELKAEVEGFSTLRSGSMIAASAHPKEEHEEALCFSTLRSGSMIAAYNDHIDNRTEEVSVP